MFEIYLSYIYEIFTILVFSSNQARYRFRVCKVFTRTSNFIYIYLFIYIQGVLELMVQTLTVFIKTQNNTFSRITKCPKMLRYRDIESLNI